MSLAGGKEAGKCDSKLDSGHKYTNDSSTSLPPLLLSSAPWYQWNIYFLFSENFFFLPKKVSFFMSKQDILFLLDHMATEIQQF